MLRATLVLAATVFITAQTPEMIYSAAAQGQTQSQQWEMPVARGDVSLVGVSGNAILDRCTKRSDRDQEYCLAWMRLAFDNRKSLKAIAPSLRDCIPQEVDDTQLRDVAIDYLRTHPKDRHLAATILVT